MGGELVREQKLLKYDSQFFNIFGHSRFALSPVHYNSIFPSWEITLVTQAKRHLKTMMNQFILETIALLEDMREPKKYYKKFE